MHGLFLLSLGGEKQGGDMPLEAIKLMPKEEAEKIGLRMVSSWTSAVVFGTTLALRFEIAPEVQSEGAADARESRSVQIALSPSQADALAERLLYFLAEAINQESSGRT